MLCLPSVAPWRLEKQRQPNHKVSRNSRSLNRVQKLFVGGGTTPGACASFRQPVIPPAPLTGDVGRGCGDASRALLFCATGFSATGLISKQIRSIAACAALVPGPGSDRTTPNRD